MKKLTLSILIFLLTVTTTITTYLYAEEPVQKERGISGLQIELPNILKKDHATFSNLILNGSFESISEGTVPDGWVSDNQDAVISQISTDKLIGNYALSIQSAAPILLSQDISDAAYFKGKKIVFGCWVKSNSINSIRLIIDDGMTQAASDYHAGDGKWQFLTVKSEIDETAANLSVKVENNSAELVYLDGACLYELTKDIVFTPNSQDNLKMPSNLIYTDLDNQRVGINTALPQEALEVEGNIRASGTILSGDNETLTQTSADSLYVNSNGDIITGDLTVEGSLTAASFVGDGSGLTNLGLLEYYTKLEADSLFSPISHNHDDIYYTETEVGTLLGEYYTKLQADELFTLIGHDHNSLYYTGAEIDSLILNYYTQTEADSLFAGSAHLHDETYYTETEIDAFLSSLDSSYVNLTGDTMTGNLNVQGNINAAGNLIVDTYLGIGTAVPTESLEVIGNIKAASFIGDGSGLINLPLSDYYTKIEADSSFASMAHGHNDVYYTETEIGSLLSGYYTKLEAGALFSLLGHGHNDLYYTESEANSLFSSITHNHDTAYVNASGDTINGNLTVAGDVSAASFIGDGSGLTNLDISNIWTQQDSDIYYQTGNVGINTATPTASLTVKGNLDTPLTGTVSAANLSTEVIGTATLFTAELNQGDAIKIESEVFSVASITDDTTLTLDTAYQGETASGITVYTDNNLYLAQNGAGVGQVVINKSGNLGIGVTNPIEKLHVAGTVKVTGDLDVDGNIAAAYQDLAEWVESEQKLTPGTVVVLDSNSSNKVLASNQAYDAKVAGVVSYQPGIILGEAAEGRYKIAHSGRVKTKVSTQAGSIKVGDLLVTSPDTGVAMRSEPIDINGRKIHQNGTILGKALEPLNEGEDEILVLLSLQ